MKKIERDGIIRGQLLCSPTFANRQAPCRIGVNSFTDDICVRTFPGQTMHRGVQRHNGNVVAIGCGTHRAWVTIPRNISLHCSIDFKHFEKEPILSILPVVSAALMFWQRAHAKTDLGTDDIVVDSVGLDGIIPIAVAAACRGTVIVCDAKPALGLFKSVADLLAVDIMTPDAETVTIQ